MQLYVHSDASYLSVRKARIRVGGIHYLSDPPPNTQDPDNYTPLINGIIHVVCKILCNIMSSAAEAELGALFLNAKEEVPIHTTLIEMNWPQPPTPIQVDNFTALGIANQTIKQKLSKAMNMRFHWVIDRIKQGQFRVYRRPGSTNLADYPTKHHSTEHHIKVLSFYLHEPQGKNSKLQGCFNYSTNSQPTTINIRPGLLNRIRHHSHFYRYLCQSTNKRFRTSARTNKQIQTNYLYFKLSLI